MYIPIGKLRFTDGANLNCEPTRNLGSGANSIMHNYNRIKELKPIW